MKQFLTSPLSSRLILAGSLAVGLASLAGCGIGTLAGSNGANTLVSGISGKTFGGVNPVIGAKIQVYATTSTGYGIGQALGASTTTDSGGNWTITNNFTCPANQFAYIVAYGGNTGANAANPNSVLMAALGPCSSLYTGTAYTGSRVLINEATTIAAGYALSNFLTVTGSAQQGTGTGFTVGIGSSASNNSTSAVGGCVANAYYGIATCPTTATSGLAHAFANAVMLVNPFTGQVNTTNASNAIIPFQFINTLGNVLQACVNSTGGGTNTTDGTPSTATGVGGTTHDGTSCGRLFAYTSYTLNGTSTGTLLAPGNTLSAIRNLAKRPSGSATAFNTTCDSGSSGSTTAAQCIFNLVGGTATFYQPSMTAAPPDWTLGVSYPKGSFSNAANGTACAGSPTTNGSLYPYMVATDINDNVVILNGDASATTCYNLITIGFDGSVVAANGFDANNAIPIWVATDAFGHAIVPTHGTVENGIRVYGATDASIPLVNAVPPVVNTITNFPFYALADQSDNIFVAAQPATNTTTNGMGYLAVSGAENHAAPVYTTVTPTTVNTNKFNMLNVDINGTAFGTQSSSSSSKTQGIASGSTVASAAQGALLGATGNGVITAADNSGNVWTVLNMTGTYSGGSATAVATPSTGIFVYKQSYTVTAGLPTLSTATLVTTLTPGAVKPQHGQIDGNNVIWYTDLQGATTTTPPTGTPVTINFSSLHGYDTVNAFDTHNYYGCKFLNATSTTCGSQPADSTFPTSTPYLFYGSRGLAIDSAGSIWVANGTQGQVNEIIGLAAPTWPLFIHNGTSNKP